MQLQYNVQYKCSYEAPNVTRERQRVPLRLEQRRAALVKYLFCSTFLVFVYIIPQQISLEITRRISQAYAS